MTPAPNLDYARDIHCPWQEPNGEVINGGKLHDQFLSCGIRQRDDVKQMQRYKPEWKAVKPRF